MRFFACIRAEDRADSALRVAILTHEYPPFIFGGIGTFIQNLAEGLASLDLDVLVIAGSPEKQPKRMMAKSKNPVEILWVPRGQLPPRHLWFQLKNMSLIRKELEDCDIVHGQDCSAFPLLQFCKSGAGKVPWAITFHTNPYAELRYALASSMQGGTLTDVATYVAGFPLWDIAIRSHARRADHLVFVSNSLREELSRTYKLDRNNVSVIHTCVNIAELENALSNRSHDCTSNVHLFYSGRLYFRKGIFQLVRIVQHMVSGLGISDFDLQIFGSGPLERPLREYLTRHGLERNIKLRGHVPRRILLAGLADSDIVCMPSLYEACPVAVIEAMAMGKPVVAFDVPFAREMLQGSSALLASDSSDFAQKLAWLIRSPDDRKRLGRMLKDRAAIFDSTQIAMEYQAIYTSLVS